MQGVSKIALISNAADYLCKTGKKILLIDWDLETHCLHYFFEKSRRAQQAGLIEVFGEFCAFMHKNAPSVTEDAVEQWLKDNIGNHILVDVAGTGTGRIDIMTAGLFDEAYTNRANNFSWRKFYEDLDGGYFLELFKKHLKSMDYDFVFVNSCSGTGVYSGICNIQIPDANVILIGHSLQEMTGSAYVINCILKSNYISEYHKRQPIAAPILYAPSIHNDKQLSKWIGSFRELFGDNIIDLIRLRPFQMPPSVDHYISDTLLTDLSTYSCEEERIFEGNLHKIEKGTLANQVVNLANLLLGLIGIA